MFIQKKDRSIMCTKCDTYVMTLRDYETQKYGNDPEWFWEPYDYEELHLYICPECMTRDFVSDSELEYDDE